MRATTIALCVTVAACSSGETMPSDAAVAGAGPAATGAGAGGSSSSSAGGEAGAGAGCAVAVSAGSTHTCAIRTDATLWCWGKENELGTGSESYLAAPTPQQVTSLGDDVDRVACGYDHSCALRKNGTLWCWGHNANGEVGTGDTTPATHPLPIAVAALAAGVTSVAAGGAHTCAVDDGDLFCWGSNGYAELGQGGSYDFDPHPTPLLLPAGDWAEPALGVDHSCARTHTGEVWCWGRNTSGEIGQGTTDELRSSPELVPVGSSTFQLAVGGLHTCARTAAALVCWGANDYLQLGTTSPVEPGEMATVEGLQDVIDVSLGTTHGCAVLADHRLLCWGNNDLGQLGVPADISDHPPSEVAGIDGSVVDVEAGGAHSCALTADRRVFCWGSDPWGQLGSGRVLEQSSEPVEVALPCD